MNSVCFLAVELFVLDICISNMWTPESFSNPMTKYYQPYLDRVQIQESECKEGFSMLRWQTEKAKIKYRWPISPMNTHPWQHETPQCLACHPSRQPRADTIQDNPDRRIVLGSSPSATLTLGQHMARYDCLQFDRTNLARLTRRGVEWIQGGRLFYVQSKLLERNWPIIHSDRCDTRRQPAASSLLGRKSLQELK